MSRQQHRCLVVDCSGRRISVALAQTNAPTLLATRDQRHGQAETLAPMVKDLVDQAGWSDLTPLTDLVACVGPGGFTGLRIAVSFALGVQAALPQLRCYGLTTQDYWRWTLDQALAGEKSAGKGAIKTAILAIDTRRDDYYWRLLDVSQAPLDDAHSQHNEQGLQAEQGLHGVQIEQAELGKSDQGDDAGWQISPDSAVLDGKAVSALAVQLVCGNAADRVILRNPAPRRCQEIDCAAVATSIVESDGQSPRLSRQLSPRYIRPPAISAQK